MGSQVLKRQLGEAATVFNIYATQQFQVTILTAGCPLPLGERHEGAPAILIDLSLLCGFSVGEAQSGSLKLAKY